MVVLTLLWPNNSLLRTNDREIRSRDGIIVSFQTNRTALIAFSTSSGVPLEKMLKKSWEKIKE